MKISLVLAVMLSWLPAAGAKGGALDGKTFVVKTAAPDGKTAMDTLSFKDGKLDSSECRKYGFKPAPYESDDELHFMATAKSDKEGTNAWAGEVRGDSIGGTMTWKK